MKFGAIFVLAVVSAANAGITTPFHSFDKLHTITGSPFGTVGSRLKSEVLGYGDKAARYAASNPASVGGVCVGAMCVRKMHRMLREAKRRALMQNRQVDPLTKIATVVDPKTGHKLVYTNSDETKRRITDLYRGDHIKMLPRIFNSVKRTLLLGMAESLQTPDDLSNNLLFRCLQNSDLLSAEAAACFKPLLENDNYDYWSPYGPPTEHRFVRMARESTLDDLTVPELLDALGVSSKLLKPLMNERSMRGRLALNEVRKTLLRVRRMTERFIHLQGPNKYGSEVVQAYRDLWAHLFERLEKGVVASNEGSSKKRSQFSLDAENSQLVPLKRKLDDVYGLTETTQSGDDMEGWALLMGDLQSETTQLINNINRLTSDAVLVENNSGSSTPSYFRDAFYDNQTENADQIYDDSVAMWENNYNNAELPFARFSEEDDSHSASDDSHNSNPDNDDNVEENNDEVEADDDEDDDEDDDLFNDNADESESVNDNSAAYKRLGSDSSEEESDESDADEQTSSPRSESEDHSSHAPSQNFNRYMRWSATPERANVEELETSPDSTRQSSPSNFYTNVAGSSMPQNNMVNYSSDSESGSDMELDYEN